MLDPRVLSPGWRNIPPMSTGPKTTEERLGPPDLTDDQVADILLDEIPAAIRIAVGQPLRDLFKIAIRRERGRVVRLALKAKRHHEASAFAIDQALPGLKPGTPAFGAALKEQFEHVAYANAATGMAIVMRKPPGKCPRCGGRQTIPGSLLGSDGQPAPVPCPECAPAPEGTVTELPTAGPPPPPPPTEPPPGSG